MSIENPPAFPLSPGDVPYYQEGMTLRDWFAGQALTSVMGTATNLGESKPDERAEAFSAIAGWLYEIADAMLAERAKVNP